MRFGRTAEQESFATALKDLLSSSDVPETARAWADGDHELGLALWGRLAELGVPALLVGEDEGGIGAELADAVIAFEALGYHGAPGPWIETAVVAPLLLAATDADTSKLAGQIAEGEVQVSLATASTPFSPRALDADIAATTLVVDGTTLATGTVGAARRSVEPARHLFEVSAGDTLGTLDPTAAAVALDAGALACSAVLLGAGERMLAEAVEYAKSRTQFGRHIGEFQALKHLLADVRVALDFARPLIEFAALELSAGTATASRDVSAAKVAASDAAYLAGRTALQVHAAIGYTMECDLSLWLLKVRALVTAWGTPAFHRARVLEALAADASNGSN
ncbi:acyl-CoA dehydrogenase [Nocardioides sp.]|uniref:acyl-CoA dehydrogenase n=1 Tax=Nocardioides sp. TaxID=35761 RepID=UPI00261BD4AD|nr:acyl-CoA dehydrogenase [Nocardioides sp.]